jgi:class 3 adenylate cyclase
VRTLEAGEEEILEWTRGSFPDVIAEGTAISTAPASRKDALVLNNRTKRQLTFIVEELSWRRDALNAHRATTYQAFRDLYDTEILRPGDNLEVDHITTMFTDLEGSTALYQTAGDFQAYSLVREFFAVLGAAIRDNNGTMVKTIGDAVHGAFSNPRDALRAAIRIQSDIEDFNARSGRPPIGVKIGLHVGRSIVVTLNNRLDYYGNAINKAARLADRSGGGDIVLSEEFRSEPAVLSELRKFRLKKDKATLKGFDKPVPFLRIPARQIKRGSKG